MLVNESTPSNPQGAAHPDGEVIIFRRPGLAEFLAAASEVAELVVFTAGMPGAQPASGKEDLKA